MSINDNDANRILTECAEACGDETLSSLWQISTNMRDLKAERDSLRAELNGWKNLCEKAQQSETKVMLQAMKLQSELDKLKEQKPVEPIGEVYCKNGVYGFGHFAKTLPPRMGATTIKVYAHPVPAQQDKYNVALKIYDELSDEMKVSFKEYVKDTWQHLNPSQQSPAVAVPDFLKIADILEAVVDFTKDYEDTVKAIHDAEEMCDALRKLSAPTPPSAEQIKIVGYYYTREGYSGQFRYAHSRIPEPDRSLWVENTISIPAANPIDYKAQRDELLAAAKSLLNNSAAREGEEAQQHMLRSYQLYADLHHAIAKCDGAKL